jgi:hypothetical protein
MTRLYGGETLAVEARDQMGDRIPAAPPGCFRRVGVARSVGDGEEGFGAGNVGRRFGLRTGDPNQPLAFVIGEWPQRIFLATSHRRTSRKVCGACSIPYFHRNGYAHDKRPTSCSKPIIIGVLVLDNGKLATQISFI